MTEKTNNPGVDSLIFKPSKVSWGINSYLINNESKFERIFISSILIVIFAFLFWAYSTSIAIVVDSQGELVTKAPPLPVSSSSSIKVKKILVANNQNVKKGDVLLHLNTYLPSEDISAIQETIATLKSNVELEKTKSCDSSCRQMIRNLAERGL